MSVASAKKFLEKVKQDREFAKKLEEASGEERARIAKEAGFEFTKEEIKMAVAASGDLSDEELDKVAGGSWVETLTTGIVTVGIVAACA